MKQFSKRSGPAYERRCLDRGYRLVIGIDEAGRGPLAGPVVAGAVALLDPRARDAVLRRLFDEVDDSKKLSAPKRKTLFDLISRHPQLAWVSAAVPAAVIDRVNILEATKIAMRQASVRLVAKLVADRGRPSARRIFCVLDGNFRANLPFDQTSVVAGDAKIFSVAAASIVAKVTRDRIMERMDKKFPGYGFAYHKGYPTRRHLEALAAAGASPIHRMSFRPLRQIARTVIMK